MVPITVAQLATASVGQTAQSPQRRTAGEAQGKVHRVGEEMRRS